MKRTKLHGFKKFSRGSMPPNHPSNAHGFAIRDMQIPKSEKKNICPTPYQILEPPLYYMKNLCHLDPSPLSALMKSWLPPHPTLPPDFYRVSHAQSILFSKFGL